MNYVALLFATISAVAMAGCCEPCSFRPSDDHRNEYTIEIYLMDEEGASVREDTVYTRLWPLKVTANMVDGSTYAPRVFLSGSSGARIDNGVFTADKIQPGLKISFPEETVREDIKSIDLVGENATVSVNVLEDEFAAIAIGPVGGEMTGDKEPDSGCLPIDYKELELQFPSGSSMRETRREWHLRSMLCWLSNSFEPVAFATSCDCRKSCTIYFRDRDRFSVTLPQ